MQLYPPSAHNAFHGVGIVFPQHIDQAVTQIHEACKGFGTDEQTLIAVLGSKSPETRNLIQMRYKELYKKSLKDLVKSETSGNFGKLLRMISTPLPETEANILRDATKGMGTNESLLVQILSGRTNEEMNILKKTYFNLHGKDLAVMLSSELSGDFKKVIMALLQSSQLEYNPAFHNAAKAEADAVALYKSGQGRIGTQEEIFIGILVACPPEYLKMVDAVYVSKYNNNIAKAIDKEFSGDAKRSLNYLVKSVMDPYPTIAEVFEKTMKGFGTDETGLSTALVRYHSVLPHVKTAYKKLYNKELRDRIYGETSGDYRKLLLEIYDAPQDPPPTKAGAAPVGSAAAGAASAQSYAAAPAATGYPAPAAAQPHGQAPAAYPGQAPATAAYPGQDTLLNRSQDIQLNLNQATQLSRNQDTQLSRNQDTQRNRNQDTQPKRTQGILLLSLNLVTLRNSQDTLHNNRDILRSSRVTLRNNRATHLSNLVILRNSQDIHLRNSQATHLRNSQVIHRSSQATHLSRGMQRPLGILLRVNTHHKGNIRQRRDTLHKVNIHRRKGTLHRVSILPKANILGTRREATRDPREELEAALISSPTRICLLILQFPSSIRSKQKPPTRHYRSKMKTSTFLAITLVATALHSVASAAPFNMRGLQQGGGPNPFPQNGFPRNNLGGWQPQANVGSPWGNQNGGDAGFSPEAFPQNGQVLNEQLPGNNNGAAPVDGLEQATTTPPATEPATATETPQTDSEQPSGAAQPTIMVLLPDFLAPSHSGSGSMMVIAGSSSSKDTETGGSSDEKKDENVETSDAATGSLSTVATALVLLLVAFLSASS
ncbi:Annexin, partial [Globisporangium splendens]